MLEGLVIGERHIVGALRPLPVGIAVGEIEPGFAVEEFERPANHDEDREDGHRLAQPDRLPEKRQHADLEEKQRRDDVAEINDRGDPVEREADQEIDSERRKHHRQNLDERIGRSVPLPPAVKIGCGDNQPCDAEDDEIIASDDIEIVVADNEIDGERHEKVLEQQCKEDRDDGDLRHAPGAYAAEQRRRQDAGGRMQGMGVDRQSRDACGHDHGQDRIGEIDRGGIRRNRRMERTTACPDAAAGEAHHLRHALRATLSGRCAIPVIFCPKIGMSPRLDNTFRPTLQLQSIRLVNRPFSIPVYGSVMFGCRQVTDGGALGFGEEGVMSSEWDLPEQRYQETRANPVDRDAGRRAHSMPSRDEGNRVRDSENDARTASIIDPVALFSFIFRNLFKIGVIALALTAVGIVLIRLMPFPYQATATVLVDPRSQQVTLQEDVLQPIGSDAAVLESMVQIMKSDGFLLTVMNQLDMTGDVKTKLSEQEQLEALAKFKKNLTVERKGATYLVEISFKAATAEDAARVANSVANGFADTQNGYLKEATESAGRELSERLVELRRKVNASEKAVADFAAEHGILYVDSNNTLEMRQLTELSAQLALAKNATEAARARYQSQIDSGPGGVTLSDQRNAEPAQLAFLRQQRSQLVQNLEQQSLTYGSRHPRIAQTRTAIEGIDRQIREEKQTLTRQLKGALDVALSQQSKLEADIAKLSSGAVLTDAAEVRLEALRREAAADRDIYEKFLSRNKTTDELAEMRNDNVRVVSPAVPPLKSSRPSIILLAPILGFLSAVAATAMLAVANRAGMENFGLPSRRNAEVAPVPENGLPYPAPSATSGPDRTTPQAAAAGGRPIPRC